jgi:hypothetical protein
VSARFPGALSPAAGEATRQAFMTGLHAGSLVAAAALLALAFLPSRPGPADGATDLPDLAFVTAPADTLPAGTGPFAQNLR